MITETLITGTILVISGRPFDIPPIFFSSIILSALGGIVLVDFFLFAVLRRIGPRRSNILFASNAVFAALLGWVHLGKVIGLQAGLAILFGVGGVALAVIYASGGTSLINGKI